MAAPLSPAAISTERQMITLQIAEGLSCFRGLSPQRSRFELEYALERGSTANSFLFAAGPDASGVSQAAVLVIHREQPTRLSFCRCFTRPFQTPRQS